MPDEYDEYTQNALIAQMIGAAQQVVAQPDDASVAHLAAALHALNQQARQLILTAYASGGVGGESVDIYRDPFTGTLTYETSDLLDSAFQRQVCLAVAGYNGRAFSADQEATLLYHLLRSGFRRIDRTADF